MKRELLQLLIRTLKEQEALIVVCVLASSGSTPRGSGATMLVFEDGHTEGTIGGGAVEHAAELHAKELLKSHSSDTVGYCLNKNDVADLGMICGGDVTVYFQYLYGQEQLPLFEYLSETYEQNRSSWLIRKIEDRTVVSMGVYDKEGLHFGDGIGQEALLRLIRPGAVYLKGEPSYYAEPVAEAGFVYVFGGGHVSQVLVPMLAHVHFPVIVFEDREAFADPKLFPGAYDVILGDFREIEASITLSGEDYVVIMTRGHQADFEVLAQCLKHPLSYIGCIGSRSKIAATKQRLIGLGYPEDCYDRVHSPIGIDIKAETPEEIAVSITAELILHRASLHPEI